MSKITRARQNAFLRNAATLSFFVLSVAQLAGLSPFSGRLVTGTTVTSSGSAFEALLYSATTLTCILAGVNSSRRMLSTSLGLTIVLLLLYCMISLTWSSSPGVAIPRFIQFTLVAVSTLVMVRAFGTDRAVRVFMAAAFTVSAVDLLSVALFAEAIHGPTNSHPSLYGSWRGLHLHKNYLGAVAAITFLMFFFSNLHRRILTWTPRHAVISGLPLIALLGSGSKTSIILTPLAMVITLMSAHLRARMTYTGRVLFVFLFFVLLFSAALTFSPIIEGILDDGSLLTGRVGLWQAISGYISTNWLTGSGYGSFWRLGDNSLILRMAEGWATRTGQAHNGYLDVMLTLGVFGLVLSLVAFFFSPLMDATRAPIHTNGTYAAVFSVVVFCLLHNLTESSLLVGNHPVFFSLLISVAVLDHREGV